MVKSSAARLDSIFHALADPTRRRILRDVAGGGEVGRRGGAGRLRLRWLLFRST